jgi:hypothetical protein
MFFFGRINKSKTIKTGGIASDAYLLKDKKILNNFFIKLIELI